MTSALYPTLADRTVLISGGATGIGAALVEHFVRQKARVAFVDIQAEAGQALARRLAEFGNAPTFVEADLTRLELIPALVQNLCEQMGPIQVLINRPQRSVPQATHRTQ